MKILILFALSGVGVFAQSGVGFNTTSPQQALHLATANGTIRIEGLNDVNNSYNGGDVNGDTNLDNDLFPLYVDNEGSFSLELKVINISEELDELNDTALPNSSVVLPSNDTDGTISTEIISYPITVTQGGILEVKYNLSSTVYLDNAKTIITDNLARRVQTHLTITGQTRKYGPATKIYSSGSTNSVPGLLYTNCTAYISLPAAGTYDLKLIGVISSDIKGTGAGTTSLDTYVEFATGNDSLFIKLY